MVVISGCGPLGIGAVAAAVQKNPSKVVALDVLDWKVREQVSTDGLKFSFILCTAGHSQEMRAQRHSAEPGQGGLEEGDRRPDRGLRLRRLHRADGEPAVRAPGPRLHRQARPLRGVRSLWEGGDGRLEHHQVTD